MKDTIVQGVSSVDKRRTYRLGYNRHTTTMALGATFFSLATKREAS